MKVLVIDYLSPKGHEGWFKLQIDSLLSLGHNVKCVFKDGFNENVGLPKDIILFQIPSSYYTTNKGLKYRFESLRILRYIKKRVKEEEWDIIIFSSYETLSLGVYPIFKSAFIINHNNLSDLGDSKLKALLFRKLSVRFHQIAFNKVIACEIENISGSKAFVVHHGLLDISYNNSEDIFEKYDLEPQKYLISPTKTPGDMNELVMMNLCNSDVFNSYLKDSGMKMLIRRPIYIDAQYESNYVLVSGFLSNNDYYTLLSNCYALILCLDEKKFCYRLSGALFESMKLNFPIFIYYNKTFDAYSKYRNGNLMFTKPEELINELVNMHDSPWKDTISEIANPQISWEIVLDKFVKK